MKYYWILIACLINLACSNNKPNESSDKPTAFAQADVKKDKKQIEDSLPPPLERRVKDRKIRYELSDSAIVKDLKALEGSFPSIPFYGLVQNEKYFVVSNRPHSRNNDHFTQGALYGIVNADHEIKVPMEYHKIYNLGITLKDCFEIEKDGKVGFYNYHSQQLLVPQFDYVFPSTEFDYSVAFGIKEGKWYQVTKDLGVKVALEFNPYKILSSLSFSLAALPESQLMYNSYWIKNSDEILTGNGVMILPSYLNRIMPNQRRYFDNIILEQQGKNIGYDNGTYDIEFTRTKEKRNTEKVKSFLISFFEQGVSLREYTVDSRNVVTYNTNNNQLVSSNLKISSDPQGPCMKTRYDFLNDSIVQVISAKHGQLYSHSEDHYEFYKIDLNGKHIKLESNRYFDFTKFVLIDESYFKGCFTDNIESPTKNHNLWQYDHLSIEELDIMRNEIFADYGYKFQTEKWQQHFSRKAWYKPRFDNVNHLLSHIDKENVKTILKVKKAMIGKEEQFRKKTPAIYYAAG